MSTTTNVNVSKPWNFISPNQIDFNALEEILKSVEYQGFDPEIIHAEMQRRSRDSNRNLSNDVLAIVCIVDARGTNLERPKVLNSVTSQGENLIRTLGDVYGIISSKPNKRTDITWGRLAITYSSYLLRWRVKKEFPPKGETVRSGIWDALCFPGGASLIPQDNQELINFYMNWAMRFDKRINGDQHSPERVEQFTRIAIDQTPIENQARKSILRELRIM